MGGCRPGDLTCFWPPFVNLASGDLGDHDGVDWALLTFRVFGIAWVIAKFCCFAVSVHTQDALARLATVKLIAEYLERAHQFERMADHENDPKLRADFEKQARAYHKLAEKRALETRLPLPKHKDSSK